MYIIIIIIITYYSLLLLLLLLLLLWQKIIYFMEFLDYNYGKEKLKRLFHLGDFLNCKDHQERSSRMIWELVLLYACFCY